MIAERDDELDGLPANLPEDGISIDDDPKRIDGANREEDVHHLREWRHAAPHLEHIERLHRAFLS